MPPPSRDDGVITTAASRETVSCRTAACQPPGVIQELRWPHGGHGDCASARAGYGVRRWPAAGRGARRRGDLLRRSASSAPTSCCQGYCQGWTAFLRFLRKQGSEGLHQQNEAVGNTGARALFSRWRLISEASLPVFQRGGEELAISSWHALTPSPTPATVTCMRLYVILNVPREPCRPPRPDMSWSTDH